MSTQMKSVGCPSIEFDIDCFLSDVKQVLTSKQLTNGGSHVLAFEKKVCKRLNVKHAICVCNATIGLQVALKALNISGRVIVPSFTFVATAHACRWIGLEVVFCDIDRESLLLDTDHLEHLLNVNSDIAAIVPVHVYGRACQYDVIEKLAEKYNVSVVYDAAHAFGSKYDDDSFVGSKGKCEVFSFHATKSLSTMEGGAIVTNDDHLAENLRRMINFGFQGYDNVISVGTNAKMCEVAAIFGHHSLSQFDNLVEHNRRLFNKWKKLFDQKSLVDCQWKESVVLLDANKGCNMHYNVLIWKENLSYLDRNKLQELLMTINIHARKYFYPGVHMMAAYIDHNVQLPKTESIANQVLCIPTGFQMTESDVERIFEFVVSLWDHRND